MRRIIALGLFLCAGPAHAQQVIAKGSWVEIAPSPEGPITLGSTSTSDACVAAIKIGLETAHAKAEELNQEFLTISAREADSTGPVPLGPGTDNYKAAELSSDEAQQTDLEQSYAAANCVQQ